jgi:hypothetical protein
MRVSSSWRGLLAVPEMWEDLELGAHKYGKKRVSVDVGNANLKGLSKTINLTGLRDLTLRDGTAEINAYKAFLKALKEVPVLLRSLKVYGLCGKTKLLESFAAELDFSQLEHFELNDKFTVAAVKPMLEGMPALKVRRRSFSASLVPNLLFTPFECSSSSSSSAQVLRLTADTWDVEFEVLHFFVPGPPCRGTLFTRTSSD